MNFQFVVVAETLITNLVGSKDENASMWDVVKSIRRALVKVSSDMESEKQLRRKQMDGEV